MQDDSRTRTLLLLSVIFLPVSSLKHTGSLRIYQLFLLVTATSGVLHFSLFVLIGSLYKYTSLPRHHLRYCAHYISLPVADQGKVWPVGQVRPVGLSNPVHQTLVQDLVKTDVHPSVWHIITNWLIYIVDSFGFFYLNYFKQHSIANQYCTTYCNSLSPAVVSLLPSTAQYLTWCLWFRPSVNICPGWSNHM